MANPITKIRRLLNNRKPRPITADDLPDVNVDLRGLCEFYRRTGRTSAEMTDEELAAYVDDVPAIRKCYKKLSKMERQAAQI